VAALIRYQCVPHLSTSDGTARIASIYFGKENNSLKSIEIRQHSISICIIFDYSAERNLLPSTQRLNREVASKFRPIGRDKVQ
jgi:hypothetical protein